jgi:ABC-2 type transport system permease protein
LITLIAKKELLAFYRDSRLAWAGGVALILLLSSLMVGWQHQHEVRMEREAGDRASYGNWLRQGEKNPHDAVHYGMYAYKPKPTLALIEPGIDPYVGSAVWMEAHKRHDPRFRPAQDATGLQRFGRLSAAWVAQILVPLFIILLGFNAFSAEREQGTLRQTISQGVSPRQLLWGKSLAIGALTGILLLPASIVAIVALVENTGGGTVTDSLLRFLWMSLGHGAYLAIFLFWALAVSASAPSSRAALLILLAVWTFNGMMAPRLASDLSRALFPTPSKFESTQAMEAEKWADQDRVFQAVFKTTRWEDLPKGSFGRALQWFLRQGAASSRRIRLSRHGPRSGSTLGILPETATCAGVGRSDRPAARAATVLHGHGRHGLLPPGRFRVGR